MKNFKSITGEPMTGEEKMREIAELDNVVVGGYIGKSSAQTLAEIYEREAEEHEAKIREYEAEAAQLIAEGHPPELVTPLLKKSCSFYTEHAEFGRRRAAELRENDGNEIRARCAARREERDRKNGQT